MVSSNNNSTPDPLIVLDASQSASIKKMVVPATKSPHRGGLRRFLSRRSAAASPTTVAKVKTTRSAKPTIVPDNKEDDKVEHNDVSVSSTVEEDSLDASLLEEDASYHPPFKVEIGTRYISIEDEATQERELAEDKQGGTNKLSSVSCLDDFLLQLATFQQRVTSGTMEAFHPKSSVSVSEEADTTTIPNAEQSLVPTTDNEGGEEKAEEEPVTTESEESVHTDTSSLQVVKNDMRLFEMEDVHSAFQGVSKSCSMDEACSFDWGDKDTKETQEDESPAKESTSPEAVATSTITTTTAAAAEVEETNDANDETKEDASMQVEESTELTKKEGSTFLDGATSSSFLCQIDDAMPDFMQAVSLEAFSFDWDLAFKKQQQQQQEPRQAMDTIESFEEYEDNSVFEGPLLLQSPNKDLDVFSIGSNEEQEIVEDESKTSDFRGLEISLTLPEF